MEEFLSKLFSDIQRVILENFKNYIRTWPSECSRLPENIYSVNIHDQTIDNQENVELMEFEESTNHTNEFNPSLLNNITTYEHRLNNEVLIEQLSSNLLGIILENNPGQNSNNSSLINSMNFTQDDLIDMLNRIRFDPPIEEAFRQLTVSSTFSNNDEYSVKMDLSS